MAGHSKWAQIKRKKAITDAKRGAVFGKLSRAISVAARGNPDPSKNLRLKGEIERARAANMPSDAIERAIRRVADKDAAALSEIQVQFIGPGGAAVIVDALTDNSNRTIAQLKDIASASGGRMAGQGTLSWMFRREGGEWVPTTPHPVPNHADQERLEAFLGALDDHDDVREVFTNADY